MRYGWRVKRPEMWLDKDGLPKYDVLNNDSIASPLKLKNKEFKIDVVRVGLDIKYHTVEFGNKELFGHPKIVP